MSLAITKANGKPRPGTLNVEGVLPLGSTLHVPALQEAPATIVAAPVLQEILTIIAAAAPAVTLVDSAFIVPVLQEAPFAIFGTPEPPAATHPKKIHRKDSMTNHNHQATNPIHQKQKKSLTKSGKCSERNDSLGLTKSGI